MHFQYFSFSNGSQFEAEAQQSKDQIMPTTSLPPSSANGTRRNGRSNDFSHPSVIPAANSRPRRQQQVSFDIY